MKKNNKGFTLIELLAALVILGLLVMLGLPKLTDAITSSKDKIYVSDAKRFIAQTEYKVKVNSSSVEMPDNYQCIVVGLKYLDASDFDSPPNDGKYLEDQSFAIIKNEEGKFEYSVRLIEEFKDNKGYKGIKLSHAKELDNKNGLGCVDTFDKDDVSRDIVSMSESELNTYINNYFGESYCYGVQKVYKELDLEDSSAVQANGIPKITSVSLTSTGSNKDFNSFKAQLRLRADDDGGREQLNVCYSLDGYDDAQNNCYEYSRFANEDGVFVQDFDFSSGRSYADDNDPIKLSIIVKDSSESYVRRELTYEFHKNEAPIIDKETTTISSKAGDAYNGINTVITLNVSDDITDVGNLDVCFDEDSSGVCDNPNNYKKYSEYFGTSNRLDYTLNTTELDGTTHNIVVYVKDEYGVEAEPYTLNYKLFENTPPDFQGNGTEGSHITISSLIYKHVREQSLKIRVSFTLLDELGNVRDDKIGVKIALLDENRQEYNASVYTYSRGGTYNYLIKKKNGEDELYNGQTYKIKVTVYDVDHPTLNNSEIVNYTVHANTAPVITFSPLNVLSVGDDVCVSGFRCDAYNRHSNLISYTYKVEDDIDQKKDLKFCVSENINDCKNPNNFKNYPSGSDDGRLSFDVYDHFEFSTNDPILKYDGADRNLYIFVQDTYGKISNTQIEGGYQLYKNKPPFIDLLEVIDEGESGLEVGSMNIKLSPKLYNNDYFMYNMHDHNGGEYVADDITDNKHIAYEIKLNGNPLKKGPEDGDNFELSLDEIKRRDASGDWDGVITFDQFLNSTLDVHLENVAYDGRILHFELILTDSYGESSSFTTDYQLYNNKPPTIDRFEIVSSEPACDDCTDGGYGVNLRVSASDDMSPSEDLYVCLAENLDDCAAYNYVSYSEFFEDKDYHYTFAGANSATAYLGQTKHLYLSVKDKNGGKSYSELEYVVYENQGPKLDDEVSVISQNDDFNSRQAIFNSTVSDDLGNLYERVCYGYVGDANSVDPPSSYVCTDYRPYNEHFKFAMNIDNYTGQKYYVYAEVMDAYGEKDTSAILEYILGTDTKPVIDSVNARYGITGRSGQGVVVFNGHDYGDSYNVCITTSNNSNNCTFSSNSYDGSVTDEFTYIYDFGSNPQNTTTTYYMFAKDSNNKISNAKSFKFSQNSSSSACETNDNFRSITYTPRGSTTMTSDTCAGRCYYWQEEVSNGKVVKEASDTVNISVPYTKKVSLLDKFDNSRECSSSTSNVSLTCGSRECFNTGTATNKKYNDNIVIGLEEHVASEDWMYHDELSRPRQVRAGDTYYQIYRTQYNPGDEYIILNPTPYYVFAGEIDDYKYISTNNSDEKYLRALDSNNLKLSKPASDMVSAKIKVVHSQYNGSLTVGDRVMIGPDSYHVVKTNSDTTVLLQDYNLLAGHYYTTDNSLNIDPTEYYIPVSPSYCKQEPDAKGWRKDSTVRKGVHPFYTGYYGSYSDLISNPSLSISSHPYIYSNDMDSICYSFLQNHLYNLNVKYKAIRLMSIGEARDIGCDINGNYKTCPVWASTGTYWLGNAYDQENVYAIKSDRSVYNMRYDNNDEVGIRYVIEINTNEITLK